MPIRYSERETGQGPANRDQTSALAIIAPAFLRRREKKKQPTFAYDMHVHKALRWCSQWPNSYNLQPCRNNTLRAYAISRLLRVSLETLERATTIEEERIYTTLRLARRKYYATWSVRCRVL